MGIWSYTAVNEQAHLIYALGGLYVCNYNQGCRMLVESCVLVKSEYSNVCRCVRNSDSTLIVSFHSNLPLYVSS